MIKIGYINNHINLEDTVMKKIVALLIAVSMLFAATAFAAGGIPSKTSADKSEAKRS